MICLLKLECRFTKKRTVCGFYERQKTSEEYKLCKTVQEGHSEKVVYTTREVTAFSIL